MHLMKKKYLKFKMEKEIIEKRLLYIKEKLKDISENIELYENYNDKKIKKSIFAAMQKWAEEVVESGVKINTLLLKEISIVPESYFESFMLLEKLEIFEDSFLKKLAGSAGFRNRLAHDYLKLDEELTFISIKNILENYKIYIIEIKKYLKS